MFLNRLARPRRPKVVENLVDLRRDDLTEEAIDRRTGGASLPRGGITSTGSGAAKKPPPLIEEIADHELLPGVVESGEQAEDSSEDEDIRVARSRQAQPAAAAACPKPSRSVSPAHDEKAITASPSSHGEKHQRPFCGVCSVTPHKYTCPKCGLLYCSVKCYESHGSLCTENFYREQVEEELRAASKPDFDEKKQLEKVLLNLNRLDRQGDDEDDEDGEGDDDADEDGTNGIKDESRLEYLLEQLESDDLDLDDLTEGEREQFEKFCEKTSGGGLLEQWVPWWERIATEETGIATGDEENHSDEDEDVPDEDGSHLPAAPTTALLTFAELEALKKTTPDLCGQHLRPPSAGAANIEEKNILGVREKKTKNMFPVRENSFQIFELLFAAAISLRLCNGDGQICAQYLGDVAEHILKRGAPETRFRGWRKPLDLMRKQLEAKVGGAAPARSVGARLFIFLRGMFIMWTR